MNMLTAEETSVLRYLESQTGQPVFCCEELARQWGRLLGFGVQGHRWTTSLNVNLYSMLPQIGREPVCVLAPIHFCPWCGEAVEVCRVK